MDKKTIDWLLEGPDWIKYAVESQLLNKKPDLHTVLNDPAIVEITERLRERRKGIMGIESGYMASDEYENPYWDLYFLADLGLTISDLNLNDEIDHFLSTQSPKGTFMTELGMEPNYLCKSAIMVSNIARMGYRTDPHVKKYVNMCLTSQRLDGGWYCNPNHDIGAPYEDDPSCPQENLNILLLLSAYPEQRTNSKLNGAIDLLLRHWDMRGTGIQIVYFGVGRRYQSMRYPATRYGILRVLDTLSLYPYAMKKASFQSMLNFVRKKAVDSKYSVETSSPYTDMEGNNHPNRLLTFIVGRIEKRISENQ